MSLRDFVKKYSGGRWDYDHIYGPQCTDLVKLWCHENKWPIPNGNGHNALGYKDFKDGFRFIRNTITGVPQVGDIMVWDLSSFGHVDVFWAGNVVNASCFSQCYPVSTICDSRGNPVRLGSPAGIITHYFYRGCVGWLRKI